MTRLLPCPFCGGTPEIAQPNIAGEESSAVYCVDPNCVAYAQNGFTGKGHRADAIAAWNRRAGSCEAPSERPEVRRFARQMELSLKAQDRERGNSWQDMTPSWLLRRLSTEVNELRRATLDKPRNAKLIALEASDVANFAMFVAEVCSARSSTER